MPSLLNYLALFLLALTLLPLYALGLYSGDTDVYETSGGEVQNEAHVPNKKWHSIAKQLHTDIEKAHNEQSIKAFGGTCNNTNFDHIRIHTPLLNESDGCLPVGFNTQTCLRRIYNGLRVYQVYLPNLEQNWFITNLMSIKVGTTRLLHLIKETVNVNDEKVSPSDLSEFTDSAWNRQQITHTILHNFKQFMVSASRAIKHMMKTKNNNEDKQHYKHQQ